MQDIITASTLILAVLVILAALSIKIMKKYDQVNCGAFATIWLQFAPFGSAFGSSTWAWSFWQLNRQ